MFIVPDLNKIREKTPLWKPGFIPLNDKQEKRPLSQSTIPNDRLILKKLGMKPKEKVISLASNHGNWAKAIQDGGCSVDYNDYSRFFINYVKKRMKFNKFIQGSFTDIPSKTMQYDWSFSYEPVEGRKSLPLAMVRSLLNKKGGIVMYYNRLQTGKAKNFPRMIKAIAEVYKIKYEVRSENIDAVYFGGRKARNKFKIFILKTNVVAREKAKRDLFVLESLAKKKLLKNAKESFVRLNKLSILFRDIFLRKIAPEEV